MDENAKLKASRYADIIAEMIRNSTAVDVVTEDSVFQEGNPANKPLIKEIMADLLLPGSQILGMEHLGELLEAARKRRPCLILMEHYSNFDIPCFYELLERNGEVDRKVAEAIVSVAGVKLNEDSDLVRSFTEVYTRVVLVPGRGSEDIADPKERKEQAKRRAKLNIAAMKVLMKLRREGRIILVFPTGTRYRPWDPSTGRGLKEIDSYVKFYSSMVTIAINGNTLLLNPNGNMEEDYPSRDVVIYTVSPVMKCSEFRREALRSHEAGKDPKQHVVDQIMAALGSLHEQTEKLRVPLLKQAGIS